MSLSRGRLWINPTIRPSINGSSLPPSRQPKRLLTSGPAKSRAPTANTHTRVPTASTEAGSGATDPLIKKYKKLRWSKSSKAPLCLKMAVRFPQGSKLVADTKRAHSEKYSNIFSRIISQSSGIPKGGLPRRPRASGPTNSKPSTPTFEAEVATASANLQSKSSAPRICKIPFGSNFQKHEHGPFVKAEGSGTSYNVSNLVLHKHPTRAKETQKPMRSLDSSGPRNPSHEQTTRGRVDIPTDGSVPRFIHFALSNDKDLHGTKDHHSSRAVKAASNAPVIAHIIRKGRTSLQPAIRKCSSLSPLVKKYESQLENPALPPIRREYGSAARSVIRRQRGSVRLVIRRRICLPKARIMKVKAGPPGSRWLDNWRRSPVRRHHSAMDSNGSLSPSVISSEVIRRSSQNPASALLQSALTPHASSSTPPRSFLEHGDSQPRAGRRFRIRRRHSVARKRDMQSPFDIRKNPAWFLTRSGIPRRRSLARNLEVLHKYVTNSAFRDCNVKDIY